VKGGEVGWVKGWVRADVPKAVCGGLMIIGPRSPATGIDRKRGGGSGGAIITAALNVLYN
jgi:hypothetical protein